MQLKRIQLMGFKSFVDATQIPVMSNMNAIVGPNGCGKSNIVDAIRWVTGEMSAKQLRGQSMSDVIFNGTSGRKPVGKAAVELVFDNSDGRITGEYAGFSEIAIRREVVRDAQSDYFINGVAARRRDLVDLFLGTGLGPRSYAIIEQGMISQLIEAKPEDLRSHFEEVAGISKYRERRRETENRIRQTQENLDRLNDLREELAKQLRHLKRQANAAEKYQELKQEQRLINAQIKALQWNLFEVQLVEKNQKIEEQALISEAELSKQRLVETNIEKSRLETDSLLDEKNDIQKRFYGLGAEIARTEQQIQHKQEQIKQWQRELAESEALFQELDENSNAHTDQIRSLTEAVLQLKPQENNLQSELQTARSALKAAEENMQQSQTTWDQFQQKISETNSAAQVAKNNIAHLESQLKNLSTRRVQLQKQLSELPLDALTSEIAPLSEKADALKNTVSELNQSLSTITATISAQRLQCDKIQKELSENQGELQKSEARFASLDALQQSTLHDQQTEALPWIEKNKLKNNVRLGKSIHVDSGYECAVETVLGDYFDAICVDNLSEFSEALNQFSHGQITLLSAAKNNIASNNTLKSILSVIQSGNNLPGFLNQIYIADDLSQALALQSQLNSSESIVTKAGVWIGANWVRIGNAHQSEESFLVREKALKALQDTINAQKEKVTLLEASLAEAKSALKIAEAARESQHQSYQQTSSAFTEAQTSLGAKQSRLNELSQQQKRFSAEIIELDLQITRYQSDLENAAILISKHAEIQQTENAERENLLAQKTAASTELVAARHNAQTKKENADQWSIRLSSNENQLSVLKQTVASNQKQLVQLNDRRATLQAQLNEIDAPIKSLTAELQTVLTQRVSIESTLKEAENKFASHQNHLKQLETERDQLIKLISSLQEAQQSLKMEKQEITVRQATLKEQLAEGDFDINNLITELSSEANLSEWESKSNQLQSSVDRLGPINLAAIEEHKAIDERKTYLDQQYQDLSEALEVLQDAIRKIDKETRQLFRDTFDQVNQKFQQLFPRIFGGGQASLELTDDNILTTGIIVKAQPPGKRNSTIHLLSGGEKTLTAISLMFAMFQLNPAPFCVLDEVDAPLDDLNVGRFCNLVKEMSKDTQFLIISHNKVTIGTADHLMGVTMQEPGVSRIVSVDIQEAVAMVDA